jgi:hypothetical protein
MDDLEMTTMTHTTGPAPTGVLFGDPPPMPVTTSWRDPYEPIGVPWQSPYAPYPDKPLRSPYPYQTGTITITQGPDQREFDALKKKVEALEKALTPTDDRSLRAGDV